MPGFEVSLAMNGEREVVEQQQQVVVEGAKEEVEDGLDFQHQD